MNIKIGDVVLAGMHKSRAKVIKTDIRPNSNTNKCTPHVIVKYFSKDGKLSRYSYAYPEDTVRLVESCEEFSKGDLITRKSFCRNEQPSVLEVMSVADGFAMVRMLNKDPHLYPFVTKAEYYRKWVKEDEIEDIYKQLETSLCVYEMRKSSARLKELYNHESRFNR